MLHDDRCGRCMRDDQFGAVPLNLRDECWNSFKRIVGPNSPLEGRDSNSWSLSQTGPSARREQFRGDKVRRLKNRSYSRAEPEVESISLQRRVRLSPGAAVEGREPRLSARLCAAGVCGALPADRQSDSILVLPDFPRGVISSQEPGFQLTHPAVTLQGEDLGDLGDAALGTVNLVPATGLRWYTGVGSRVG
jgi:hypothetical protein